MSDDKLRLEQIRLNKIIEDAWLGDIGDIDITENVFNSQKINKDETEIVKLLRILMNPDNFYLTSKYVLNIELLPFQLVILKELWTRKYPMFIASRGASKSFSLALYAVLRALLTQGSKVVVCGSGFRQSKVVFDYCERIWNNAPVLRSMSGSSKRVGPHRGTDQWTLEIGNSVITALPIGDGEKIRGQRASHIIADEFKSHNPDIFETVIAGFGAVSASPVESVKTMARIEKMKEMGMWDEKQQAEYEAQNFGNQIVISGTAFYASNHFYKYWNRYCQIINSRGDEKKINEIFQGKRPENFNHKDYSVIRLPVELVPKGFMDDKNVSLSRALATIGNFSVEYSAVFSKDSDGFFRRQLVDSCVAPITFPTGEVVNFSAALRGSPHKKYVYAIDPASERDNFSIVILELHDTHRRVVYCWTTTKSLYHERIKKGKASEMELDFYAYCVRHVRNLMKVFPCERIMMDSQGGGFAIEEAFHDKDKIQEGEKFIWRVIDPEKEYIYDNMQGLHIIEMVNFSDGKWVSDANHGLKKDMEDKAIIFPYYDSITLGIAFEEDEKSKRLYDTLEDCASEIEEMKDELTTIVMTPTGNANRDRWDTPEIKKADSKKGRMRKDRYSAVLMANMGARVMARAIPQPEYEAMGGFAGFLNKDESRGDYINPPAWFTNPFKGTSHTGFAVKKR